MDTLGYKGDQTVFRELLSHAERVPPQSDEELFLNHEYLDMYGGHAVTAVGHNHPRVVEAIREQAGDLLFYSNVVPLRVREQLFEALSREGPTDLGFAFLVNSGAEARDRS